MESINFLITFPNEPKNVCFMREMERKCTQM
jgi:hypothetical protein